MSPPLCLDALLCFSWGRSTDLRGFMRIHSTTFAFAVTMAVSALLLFIFSWNGSFLNHDEITYLEMARNMLESGNWLDLVFQDAVVHQRPPLAIWLLALSGASLGFGEFAMRLPGILMALGTLGFLFGIVRSLFERRMVAVLVVFSLLATHLFYFNARRPMTDTTLLFGMTAFVYFYLCTRINPRFWLAAGVAGAWMVMTKSVVSALPVFAVVMDLALSKRRVELKGRWFWSGVVVTVALAAPWHVAQSVRHAGFWSEYLGFNVLQRASSSLFVKADPLFYFGDLFGNEGVWGAFLLAGFVWSAVAWIRGESRGRLGVIWVLAIWIPLNVASTRISHYMLPAYPALALCMAVAYDGLLARLSPGFAWVILGVVLLFLPVNSGYDLAVADYSPDQKRFAGVVEGLGESVTDVVALNVYELSFFFYSHRPVAMLTTDPGFKEIVDSAPILERVNAASLVSSDELALRSRKPGFVCITEERHLPLLCGEGMKRCLPGGDLAVMPGSLRVLVVPVTGAGL